MLAVIFKAYFLFFSATFYKLFLFPASISYLLLFISFFYLFSLVSFKVVSSPFSVVILKGN